MISVQENELGEEERKMCNSSFNPLDDGNPLHSQSVDQLADVHQIQITYMDRIAKANPFTSRHNSSANFNAGTLITLQPESSEKQLP